MRSIQAKRNRSSALTTAGYSNNEVAMREARQEGFEILTQERKWQVTGHEVEVVLLVALKQGVIAGSSSVRTKNPAEGEWIIESTYVGEEYRAHGIAGALNQKSIDLAIEKRAQSIGVSVHRSNRFYIRSFMRLGFRIRSKDLVRDTIQLVKPLK